MSRDNVISVGGLRRVRFNHNWTYYYRTDVIGYHVVYEFGSIRQPTCYNCEVKNQSEFVGPITGKVPTLEKLSDPSFNTRDKRWSSFHCKMDIELLGLWSSKQAKDADVCCVNALPEDKKLVAMGDGHGYVSLFRFPCMRRGAFSHTYRGHSVVHNIIFSPDGKYLISIGGRDCCIIQWKLV